MNQIKTTFDIVFNFSSKKDIVIIHLADIHFNTNIKKKKLLKLAATIKNNQPDYVAITGDLIDDPSIINQPQKVQELIDFLVELSSFSKVLISLGNHDMLGLKDLDFFNSLANFSNIYLLHNISYQDEYIYFAGFTLPNNYYYNESLDENSQVLLKHLEAYPKLINNLPTDIPKVLLIHSPIKLVNAKILDKLYEYDLILSGHTHGGMNPDWFNNIFKGNRGLIAPNNKLFPKIARGKILKDIRNKKITIIINSGITKLSKKSGKIFSKLNFLYNMNINKIVITKKRGKNYE